MILHSSMHLTYALIRGKYGVNTVFIAYAIAVGIDRNNPIEGSFGAMSEYRSALDYAETTLGIVVKEFINKYLKASKDETLVISNINGVMIVHRELANKMASESIVLLKNDGVLPLANAKKIFVYLPADLPFERLVFDHARILRDYLATKA